MAVVLMPEASVDEDERPPAWKHEVGFTGQVFCVQPVAKPCRMKGRPDLPLGFGVAAFNGSHIPAAGGRVMNVSQRSRGSASFSCLNQRLNMRLHDPGDLVEDRYRHRIAELLVRLRVRNRDAEIITVTHQAGALARRQAARIHLFALTDQNLRTVFIVTGGEGAGDIAAGDKAEPEAIASGLVLRRIALQIFPELIG